jgi:hypothetical protein
MPTNQSDPNAIPSTSLAKAKDFLRKNGTGGSWAYHPGQAPSVEATAWCAIAMRNDEDVRASAISYLMNVQNSDGGWSSEHTFGISDWNSTLGLLSLRLLSDTANDKKLKSAVQFLLDDKTDFYNPFAKVIVSILKGREFLQYPQGWPWNRDCFHWVEPTSYALLALKPLSTPSMKESLQRADAFLIDHACIGGGWNHGDYKPLGFPTPPYPVTTAQALCALQDIPSDATVQAGLHYLNKVSNEQNTVMSLAWSILARDLYGEDTAAQKRKLSALQNSDGSFGNNLLLSALATCALEDSANPLRLPVTK